MNIFSKISTFVSFYYFSKCNIYASTLSKGNNLFLLFIFFPILIISRQQFKGMIQIHLPRGCQVKTTNFFHFFRPVFPIKPLFLNRGSSTKATKSWGRTLHKGYRF